MLQANEAVIVTTPIVTDEVPALPPISVSVRIANMDIDAQPTPDWTPDQLGAYALTALTTSEAIEANLATMTRKSVTSYFRAGKALWLAREMLKPIGGWVGWQDAHGLKRTTVFEAIQFFEHSKAEDAVIGMTLPQAKTLFIRSSDKGLAMQADIHPHPKQEPHPPIRPQNDHFQSHNHKLSQAFTADLKKPQMDLKTYLEICQKGELYNRLMGGMKWSGTKDEFKRDCWFQFLYGSNKRSDQLETPERSSLKSL